MPTIVTTKGMNCSAPERNISLNMLGLANLYPTMINIAEREANGIRDIMGIKNRIAIKSQNPCKIAEFFVLAPKLILAELLTMTCVNGKAPTKPHKRLPNPCAFSSLLGGLSLLNLQFTSSLTATLNLRASHTLDCTAAILPHFYFIKLDIKSQILFLLLF